MKNVLLVAGAAVVASSAHAQFITGITKPVFGVNQPIAYLTDVGTGSSSALFDIELDLGIPATAPGFGGLAGDDGNRRFFASVRNGPNDDIYEFRYNDLFNPILRTATFGSAGQDVAIDGLAYDTSRGVLYGTRTLASANEAEGLFTIDLSTGLLTNVLDYAAQAGGASAYNIAGIDYDAGTDRIYLIDEQSAGGRWIYSFDPSNPGLGLTQVAALPAEVTDIDGLGAGGGQLLLVTDNASANGGLHYVYDLALGTFSTIASPYPAPAGTPIAPNPSGAGAYVPNIPAPGALAVIGAAGLFSLRRRR